MMNNQRMNRHFEEIHDSLHLHLDQDNGHDDHDNDKDYVSHGKSSDETSFGLGWTLSCFAGKLIKVDI